MHLSKTLITVVFLVSMQAVTAAAQSNAVRPLWRDPGNVSALDLRYGPGSAELAPQPPFTFIEEDKEGASPKFRVKDARDVTWVVKLGVESQAETVANRLVWAAGYFVEESYYLDRAEITGLPKLSRGTEFVEGSVVRGARFEPRRENVKRGDIWDWNKNPFVGRREFDGLKVLMVLLSNYDTRPENNRVMEYYDPVARRTDVRYVVTDLGATLGHVGGLGGKRSKNDLDDFRESKFIESVEKGHVVFHYKTRPEGIGKIAGILNPMYGKSQAAKEKAMRRIPVPSVRWIAGILSRLTPEQLMDAFDAAGYDKETADGFISVLRQRIDQLAAARPDTASAPVTQRPASTRSAK